MKLCSYEGDDGLFQHEGVGICECRVPSESADDFRNALAESLQRNPGIQVLYLAAHGGDEGLIFATESGATVTYGEISQIIRENTQDHALQVVFGSCRAMGGDTKIESLFPDQVYEVVGFWDKPTDPQAADLMASVLMDHVRLFRKVSNPSKSAIARAGSTNEQPESELRRIIRAARDEHIENYTETLASNTGRFIVRAVRDPDSGTWSRMVHELPARPPHD